MKYTGTSNLQTSCCDWKKSTRYQNIISNMATCVTHLFIQHVDEPLASCMIVHFSVHISKWELVCKFGVIFHIFIISCLCSRFHVRNQWFFYSVITFSYIKCFVHSYTVDVVFTLSYYIRWKIMSVWDGFQTWVLIGWKYRHQSPETISGHLCQRTSLLTGDVLRNSRIPQPP